MPRTSWNRLAIVVLALPLASCFDDVSKCTTCPPDRSATIEVAVPQLGALDSVHISVDGGARMTVKRGRRGIIESLSSGPHVVTIVRWLSFEGVPSVRTSQLQITLQPGETRSIVFHNDFPLVAWSPGAGTRGAGPPRLAGQPVGRVG